MLSVEYVAKHIYEKYILPALSRGSSEVTIAVRQIWKDLNGSYSLDIINSVLASMKFRNSYHLNLIDTTGQVAGLPTAYRFGLEMHTQKAAQGKRDKEPEAA